MGSSRDRDINIELSSETNSPRSPASYIEMAATIAKSEAAVPIVHKQKPKRIGLSLPFGATAAYGKHSLLSFRGFSDIIKPLLEFDANRSLFAGGLSGLVEAMVCHPLGQHTRRLQIVSLISARLKENFTNTFPPRYNQS